ncbi:uncharacterized protein SCHCODRAFT_02685112 [Schizophyllum commune H4-8]|uniref:Uncharacterized protein n=1 Tax=Schizophyllum commune (strain H4-8 / FGSC 9210) TaxID=578458 RepID=D8PYK1_SCHCM|nr:uncharacterized protein SCHCODRAFT_02685112 [Schizophyllum commune H4-8]KAI5895999.1 hypothetical protein SCHCODRAFT_02685112 [Schizophyllum commune H4-8]
MSLIRPIDIPEVLYAIFDAAAPRPELVSHRRPRREEILSYARILGRYALVSRLWNECATPALWEMLPDQLPLFKLLPADAWSMIDRETRWTLLENGIEFASNQIFDIKRELKADDWVVLQRLAPHVKALCFAGGAFISFCLTSNDFMPPRLIETTTNSFHFSAPQRSGTSESQFYLTPLQSWATYYANALGLPISTWMLCFMTSSKIKRLGDSTHVLTKPESALTLRAWHTAIFRSLRSLQLASVCPAFALALLRSLGGAPRAIERLHMPITHFRTRDEMRELIEAVAQHCAPTALVYLNIMAGHLPAINLSQPLDPLLVSIDFFRPLARHRRLEQVFLGESVGGVDLSDDDYSELAQWWPDLVHLRIPNARGNSCTSRTLLAFAKHCKRLESLNLNLDARSPCLPYSEIAEATREPHVLQRLEINGGSVEVAEDMMAELLSALFPGLKEVEHQGSNDDPDQRVDVSTSIAMGPVRLRCGLNEEGALATRLSRALIHLKLDVSWDEWSKGRRTSFTEVAFGNLRSVRLTKPQPVALVRALLQVWEGPRIIEELAVQVVSEFGVPVAFNHLRPLSRHHRLKVLHLGDNDGAVNINEAGWHQIAQRWPEMEDLLNALDVPPYDEACGVAEKSKDSVLWRLGISLTPRWSQNFSLLFSLN